MNAMNTGPTDDAPEVMAEVRGQVGFITLNRPSALNALSLAMIRALPQCAKVPVSRHREAAGRGDPCMSANDVDCRAALAMPKLVSATNRRWCAFITALGPVKWKCVPPI